MLRTMRKTTKRRGIVAPLAATLMPVLMGFLAYGIDQGKISYNKTALQNAVDAAALAASVEIVANVEEAGDASGQSGEAVSPGQISEANARAIAADVAARNGVYINPDLDVKFGRRTRDPMSGEWTTQWGSEPYNVVNVRARRTNPDLSAPDSKLPLIFGTFVGMDSIALTAEASASVESRDIVVVMDYSGSMNYDSQLRWDSIDKLGKSAIEDNMEDIYNALELDSKDADLVFEPAWLTVYGEPSEGGSDSYNVVTFMGNQLHVLSTKDISNVVVEDRNGNHYKFDNLEQQGVTNEHTFTWDRAIYKCWVKAGQNASGEGPGYGERFDNTTDAVLEYFGLNDINYPYPSGSWRNFVEYCRNRNSVPSSAGYHMSYGGKQMVNYLLDKKRTHSNTPDIWKTPHYPFHAVREGTTLLLDFLNSLEFGDDVGLVSYDTHARYEQSLNMEGYAIDLSSDPICQDYEALDLIQKHRQAAHYDVYTNVADGLYTARQMLEAHARAGARPTILLMSDGNANRSVGSTSLPADWDWADYTDYDGDGDADYSTNDGDAVAAILQAADATQDGYTVHTMSVGANADKNLMKAIAHIGNGLWIDVPGGSSILEIQQQLNMAFGKIASKVPPPKLVYEEEM